MSLDEITNALEPFKRVATEGRERPGTGLGLPLTKALAEANRASFDISSEPGHGTTVEITFPTTRVLAD
jgi:signal transduction histidine kinase